MEHNDVLELKSAVNTLISEVKEMKQDVKDNVKQGIIHNEILRTHEARSLTLQAEQIEQKAIVTAHSLDLRVVKYIGAALGTVSVGLLIQFLAHHLF